MPIAHLGLGFLVPINLWVILLSYLISEALFELGETPKQKIIGDVVKHAFVDVASVISKVDHAS